MRNHPDLGQKLELLYKFQLNPDVKNSAELARRLGISRQAISIWINGSASGPGDSIPHAQVNPVAEIFGIEGIWFTLPLKDFETELRLLHEKRKDPGYSHPEDISLSLMPVTAATVYGREDEIALLNRSWADPGVNIVQIVAFGGVGKSTVVNGWLAEMSEHDYRGAKRVYAWSFYWQGASPEIQSSGDFFIEHALEWFGDPNPVQGSPWAKAARLARLIRAKKTLLILDGLEPLQFGSASNYGNISNQAVLLLLKELASSNSGLCIVTSRLHVNELSGSLESRVKTIDLSGLSISSSKELLHSYGVRFEDAQAERIVKAYDGHALCLHLLCGYLRVAHEGSISKAGDLGSLLREKNQGEAARDLMNTYITWILDKPEFELLIWTSLFHRKVLVEELKALVEVPDCSVFIDRLRGLSRVDWKYCVSNLEATRLIVVESEQGMLAIDCHPLVRDSVVDHLKKHANAELKKAHGHIFNFLTEKSDEHMSSVSKFEKYFQAVMHGTQAGFLKEAFDVYFNHIKRGYVMLPRGSHHVDQACLRSFFEVPWERVKAGLPKEYEFQLKMSAAANLMSLGEINEAIPPSYASINWFVENSLWIEAATSAGPLTSMLLAVGRIDEAQQLCESMERVVDRTNNDVTHAMLSNFTAYISHLRGNWDEAKVLFERAEPVLTKREIEYPVSFPVVSAFYCKHLIEIGNALKARKRAELALEWRASGSWQTKVDTPSLLASDTLMLGLACLQLGDFDAAETHLERQVEILRECEEWLYLPIGLIARSQLSQAIDEPAAAASDLHEAVQIAERTGALATLVEARLQLSALMLAQQNPIEAREHFDLAKKVSGLNGYAGLVNLALDLENKLYGAS